MEIVHREQLLVAVSYPCFTLGILAFGTVSVPAAVIRYPDMSALFTTVNMASQG